MTNRTGATGSEPGSDPSARTEITAQTERYAGALRDNDTAGILALWTDDGVYLDATTPTVVGRAALDSMFQGIFAAARVVDVSLEIEEIMVDRDLAFERLSFMETVHPHGAEPMAVRGRAFLVWRRGPDGTWRIARGIGTPLPDAPSH